MICVFCFYLQVLKALKNAMPSECAAKKMVLDFESGMWGAVRSVFPDVDLQGCLFHWTQAVWRKVQNLGLQVGNSFMHSFYEFLVDMNVFKVLKYSYECFSVIAGCLHGAG